MLGHLAYAIKVLHMQATDERRKSNEWEHRKRPAQDLVSLDFCTAFLRAEETVRRHVIGELVQSRHEGV